MNWYEKAQLQVKLAAFGQAYLDSHRPGEFVLSAIDIFDHSEDGGPNYQKRGFGTMLMGEIAKYLKAVGAKSLSTSNEGSGTIQMLDKVFGRQNVKHFHGGEEVDFERAKHVMDVMFGYTGSKVNLQPKNNQTNGKPGSEE